MSRWPPEVFRDRAFMTSVFNLSGALLEFCPAYVRRDPALVELAVRTSPNAIEFADPALRADKKLGLLAVRADGYSVTFLAESLQNDKDIALAAVTCSPWCLRYVDERWRKDRDVVRTAALRNFDALEESKDPALYRDLELMRALAEANPLTLEILEKAEREGTPTCRLALIAANPKLEADKRTLRARLDRAHINWPGRFGTRAMLEEILTNRENPERTDGRPLAVLVESASDYNGAMYHTRYDALTKNTRVMYYEAASDRELVSAVRQATTKQPASLLLISGHGTQKTLELEESFFRFDRALLDTSDEEMLDQARLPALLKAGGSIVLQSCTTGEGKQSGNNLARMFGRLFPQAHVYAPTVVTNNWLQWSDDGHFVGPGFLPGKPFTYHIAPTAK